MSKVILWTLVSQAKQISCWLFLKELEKLMRNLSDRRSCLKLSYASKEYV